MNGAEPNNVSKEGIPVLLHACESSMDNEDMCLLLIQKGADPNSKQEVNTVKPVLSGHSKRRPKICFQDWLSLSAGQKYCRMLQESILQ